jgi:hypothetical protein
VQGHHRQLSNHKASPYGFYDRTKALCLGQLQSSYGQALSDHLSATGEVWERLFLLAHRVCDDLPWSTRMWGKASASGCQSPDLFHQRSAAGGRPAAAELRPHHPGGAGAVRGLSHPGVVQLRRATPRGSWDRCRLGNKVLGSVNGSNVL